MTIHNLSGNFQPQRAEIDRKQPKTSAVPPVANEESKLSGQPDLSKANSLRKSPIEAENTSDKNGTVNQNSSNGSKDIKITESMKDEINHQIQDLSQYNQSIERTLQFNVDEELGVTVVKVLDKETNELVRQFPQEEILNFSRKLKELNEENMNNTNTKGFFLQEKV